MVSNVCTVCQHFSEMFAVKTGKKDGFISNRFRSVASRMNFQNVLDANRWPSKRRSRLWYNVADYVIERHFVWPKMLCEKNCGFVSNRFRVRVCQRDTHIQRHAQTHADAMHTRKRKNAGHARARSDNRNQGRIPPNIILFRMYLVSLLTKNCLPNVQTTSHPNSSFKHPSVSQMKD